MNKIKMILVAVLLLLMGSATNSFAQTLEGVWEGHVLSVGKSAKIPANAAFNWTTNKWGLTLPAGSWSSYDAKLDIGGDYENLTGNYSADDKNNPNNSGHYAFSGSFNFSKKLMTWQPEQKIGGKTEAANTVIRSLNYSQEGDYEYLRGRWAALDGSTGVMEFRRDYSGTPLKDGKVVSDLIIVETDHPYVIRMEEFFLSINGDKDGVISKKDANEEARKWKFEAAPDQFNKAFRIVPIGKEDQCLVSLDTDTGTITLADKADNPDGEQYWRFERSGDGVVIVNVKLGGRGIHINDEASGQTILRSRNEAQRSKWTLEKQ